MDDRLSISLNMAQVDLLYRMLRGFLMTTDEDGVPDSARAVAQSIYNSMVDAAVLEGKVDIENLPPREEDDDDYDA
jgi:hypothetical protein